MTELTIALSKGRILKDTLPLFAAAGIEPLEDISQSRKLIFETNQPGVRLLVIRATDVPVYVQQGAADLGVSGKDVLVENGAFNLYEPLDLEIAKCRLAVAGTSPECLQKSRPRVATKYVNIARRWFAEKGQQVDIIKLYGAMELGPLVGLSDVIVDLVDTGNTLRANGLQPLEDMMDISSRLVVNQAAMKTKHAAITQLVDQLAAAVAANRA